MLTIRLDSWDYALNQNEICEQILCEFGIVNIALEIPSERERIQAWNNMNNSFDFSEFHIAVNGKEIYNTQKTGHRKNLIGNKEKMKKTLKIKYDGGYPNLCSGHLLVYIGKKEYDFGYYALESGGNVWFDKDWYEHVEEGNWILNEAQIPKNFPKDRVQELIELINKEIPHGCCGGCV